MCIHWQLFWTTFLINMLKRWFQRHPSLKKSMLFLCACSTCWWSNLTNRCVKFCWTLATWFLSTLSLGTKLGTSFSADVIPQPFAALNSFSTSLGSWSTNINKLSSPLLYHKIIKVILSTMGTNPIAIFVPKEISAPWRATSLWVYRTDSLESRKKNLLACISGIRLIPFIYESYEPHILGSYY